MTVLLARSDGQEVTQPLRAWCPYLSEGGKVSSSEAVGCSGEDATGARHFS